MTPLAQLQSFAAGNNHSRHEIESSAWRASPTLTGKERLELTQSLLTRLDAEKKAHGPAEQRRYLLRDAQINTLVNALVIVNKPWIVKTLGKIKHRLHLADTAEEMFSLAVAGREKDAGGMTGAVLMFDLERYGIETFLPYIPLAVWNSFLPSGREKRVYAAVESRMRRAGDGEEESWVDRATEALTSVAARHELRGIFDEALAVLPKGQVQTGQYIIERFLGDGQMPSNADVARAHVPPVSGERGRQLAMSVVAKMKQYIMEEYPDLAEASGFAERGR